MKHTGSCHCKKVSYEADFEIGQVISCNCSYCVSKGALLSFVLADKFTLIEGEDALTRYTFNKKVIDHLFCKYCGVESFARGKNKEGNDIVAINLRSLHGIDIDALSVVKVDGKNW